MIRLAIVILVPFLLAASAAFMSGGEQETGAPPVIPASDPVAAFTPHRTTCDAPCYVHFDGTSTTDADTTVPAVDLSYEWNFGDFNSGNWRFGAIADDGTGAPGVGPSKNVDYGVSGAHVYENPGTYEVTLRVRDDLNGVGATSTATALITVNAPTGRVTHCVSNDTNQAGCIGTNHNNVTDLDVALATLCNIDAGTDLICSFQRGDTFNIDTRVDLSGARVMVNAHEGPGADPIFLSTFNSAGHGFMHVVADIDDYVFMDLDIRGDDSIDQKYFDLDEAGASEQVDNTLWLRVNIRDFDASIEIEGNPTDYGPDGDATNPGEMNHFWAFVDGSILDANGCGGNDIFAMGHGYAILGSKLGDKEDPHPDDATDANWLADGACQPGAAEHVLRSKFNDGGVTSHNSMGRFTIASTHDGCGVRDSTNQPLSSLIVKQIAGFAAQHSDPAGESRHYVYADNVFHLCSESALGVDIDATSSSGVALEHHREYWFMGNHCIPGGSEADDTPTCFELAGSDFNALNNSCDYDGGTLTGGRCINIEDRRIGGANPPTKPSPQNVKLYGTTCHYGAAMSNGAPCITVEEHASATSGVDVSNSLLYDANGSTAFVLDNGLQTTFCEAGVEGDCNEYCDATDAGANDCDTAGADTNPFVGTLVYPTPASELALGSTATLIDAGVNVGIGGYLDAANLCRSPSMDIGAHERSAVGCLTTPGVVTTWTGGAGNFSDAGHWTNGAPGPADQAVIASTSGTGTITLTAAATVGFIDYESDASIGTLALAGFKLHANADATFDGGALSATGTTSEISVGRDLDSVGQDWEAIGNDILNVTMLGTGTWRYDTTNGSVPHIRTLDAAQTGHTTSLRLVGSPTNGSTDLEYFTLAMNGGTLQEDTAEMVGGTGVWMECTTVSGNCPAQNVTGTGTVSIERFETENTDASSIVNADVTYDVAFFDLTRAATGAWTTNGPLVVTGTVLLEKGADLGLGGEGATLGGLQVGNDANQSDLTLGGGVVTVAGLLRFGSSTLGSTIDLGSGSLTAGSLRANNAPNTITGTAGAVFELTDAISGCTATDYFVKTGGSDGASGLDDANAWATWANVNSNLTTTRDCSHFNRDDTFAIGAADEFIPAGPGVTAIGAYGTGARPVLNPAPGEVFGVGSVATTGDVYAFDLRLEF